MELMITDFSGGINRKDSLDKLSPGEYSLLINGRTRNGSIAPAHKPLLISGIIANIFQGVIGVGQFLIVCADGYFYWRDESLEGGLFNLFKDAEGNALSMDAHVDVHFCAVTNSSMNYKRLPSDSTLVNAGVKYSTATVNGLPACIVAQDGNNQAMLLFQNGTMRRSQTYAEWNDANREYVPIGTGMHFDGNKLFIMSPQGGSVYQSVSGRALDFVIAVDNNGLKAADATDAAIYFSYSNVSGLAGLYNSRDLFVSTRYDGFRLTPTDNLVFGEPLYNRTSIATGALNPYSITQAGGSTVFVDSNGIKEFNAVESALVKTAVVPLSLKVQPLMEGLEQAYPVCTSLGDYTYFAVNTIFGEGVLVFDQQKRVFVSLDIDPLLTNIKRFAVIDDGIRLKLIVMTTQGIYYYGAGDNAEVQFYVGDISSGSITKQLMPSRFRLLFNNTFESGSVAVDLYVDGKMVATETQTLTTTLVEFPAYPWSTPFAVTDKLLSRNKNFNYEGKQIAGNRLGFFVRWDFEAELSAIQVEASPTIVKVAPNQQLG
jgi:hypothetical protein